MKRNVTYHIDEELVEQVKLHKQETGIPKSTIVEFALRGYLNKHREVNDAKQSN